MGHFAKVENGIVTKVIVADLEFFETFIDDSPGNWIQTSYNTRGGIHYDQNTGLPSDDQSKALRKNYAAIGYKYDENLDAFIPRKPYNSWILNEDTCTWDPPVSKPDDENIYIWNEETLSWDLQS